MFLYAGKFTGINAGVKSGTQEVPEGASVAGPQTPGHPQKVEAEARKYPAGTKPAGRPEACGGGGGKTPPSSADDLFRNSPEVGRKTVPRSVGYGLENMEEVAILEGESTECKSAALLEVTALPDVAENSGRILITRRS